MKKKQKQDKTQQISDLGQQFADSTTGIHAAIAHKAGLSATDQKYIMLLGGRSKITAGELSIKTGLTTGAVTGLIDRFEKKKLLKREFDKNDRRKTIIVPNQENINKLIASYFAELQKKMTAYSSKLSGKETKIIKNYLISAIKIMDDLASGFNPKNQNLQNHA